MKAAAQSPRLTCTLSSIEYRGRVIQFTEDNAQLPIVRRDGSVDWVTWGRRLRDPGALPMGRAVTREDILSGAMSALARTPAKVPAARFCMYWEDKPRWFDVPIDKRIQAAVLWVDPHDPTAGLVAYVVTVPAPADLAGISALWPRLV